MSNFVPTGIALAAVVLGVCWGEIRDAHQRDIWRTDPDFPRYGATNLQTLRWWLQ